MTTDGAQAARIAALKSDVEVLTRDLANLKNNFIDWNTL